MEAEIGVTRHLPTSTWSLHSWTRQAELSQATRREPSPADFLTLDFWLPVWERINFC